MTAQSCTRRSKAWGVSCHGWALTTLWLGITVKVAEGGDSCKDLSAAAKIFVRLAICLVLINREAVDALRA